MEKCAIALGNFDGVHIAHQEIITNCVNYAKEKGIKSCVLLFDIHTKILTNKENVKLLTPFCEKEKLLEQLGVDIVFLMEFNDSTMKMSDADFFDFLVNELKASALFAGFNYTFGYKAVGNSQSLVKMCEKSGIYINIINEINAFDKNVSSTNIKEYLNNGKMREVTILLNRMYSVCGKIEKGKQNGTKMGIPTANISFSDDKLLPSDGVYKGIFKIEEKEYKCIINIGKNPTFNADKRTLEVHIPGFSENIYNIEAKVFFEEKIRNEIKFNSPDELIEQIKKDLKTIIE